MDLILGSATPMLHQAEDVERLAYHTRINVWNGLGTGKTPTVAWWLQQQWLRGSTDIVVLVAPSMCTADWESTLCGLACPEGMVKFIDCRPPDAGLIAELLMSDLLVEPGVLTVLATTYGGLRSVVGEKDGRSFVVKIGSELLTRVRGRRITAVFDEAQAAALPTAAQGRACRAFAAASISVASMTATPIGNPRSMRLWGLTRLVRPDLLMAYEPPVLHGKVSGARGSFDAFKARYGMLVDPVSRQRNTNIIVPSRSYVVDVNQAMIEREVLTPMAPFTCRRRKEDCLDLPNKVYMVRAYRLPPSVQQHMDDLINHDRAILDSGTVVVPRNVLEERLRTLELTGGWVMGEPVHDGKLVLLDEVVSEIAENFGEKAPKCIWASRSREVVAAALVAAGTKPRVAQTMASACYPPGQSRAVPSEYSAIVDRCERGGVGIIHGPTSDKNRDRIQSDWRSGRLHSVAAHPGVAGAGLNWQHCMVMVYYSPTLGSIARRQSEDRMHRRGLRHTAMYYDLVMEDGPDAAVLAAHRGERSAATSLLNWLLERSKSLAA